MTIDYTEAHVLLDALTHLNHALAHGEQPWASYEGADSAGPENPASYADAVRTAAEKVRQIIQDNPPDHPLPKEARTYLFEQAAVIVYETDWEGKCHAVSVCTLDDVDLPQMFTGLIDATDEEWAVSREDHADVYERANNQVLNRWGSDFVRASCPGDPDHIQWDSV